jgi:hypothetical protein
MPLTFPFVNRLTVAAALVAVAAVPSTAEAMTTKQAKRAVAREVRFQYPDGFNFADPGNRAVTCRRLSSRMFNCRWYTLTHDDVQAGDVDGHSGVGYVRGRSVRIITLDCGTCS